jgi:hypothetical protein
MRVDGTAGKCDITTLRGWTSDEGRRAVGVRGVDVSGEGEELGDSSVVTAGGSQDEAGVAVVVASVDG